MEYNIHQKISKSYVDEGKITHPMSRTRNSLDSRPVEHSFSIPKQKF